MEGDALRAAGFAKIAKTTRVKAEKALKAGGIVNFAKTALLRTKYGILLLIKFLSKFSPMQLSLGTLIAYYMVWPNLKPKLREILKKVSRESGLRVHVEPVAREFSEPCHR